MARSGEAAQCIQAKWNILAASAVMRPSAWLHNTHNQLDHLMVTHWSESRTPWVGSAVQITTWRLLRDGDRIYVPVGVCMRIGAGTLTSLDYRLSGPPRRPGVYSCCKVSHCSQLTKRWPSCVVPNRWAGHVSTTLKLSKV